VAQQTRRRPGRGYRAGALRRTVAGFLSGILAVTALATGVTVSTAGPAGAAPSSDKDVTAVMFPWTWDAIARECTQNLGPAGYGYVQTSPPQEHVQGTQWWTSYQPVS